VAIDWATRKVIVDGRVTLRDGPLEFLACFGGKEHESVVRLEASGTHIYMALGLLGFTPGRPPQWDETTRAYRRPQGDLLELSFTWEAEGRRRTAAALTWTREIEYARVPLARPWVFAGSLPQKDGTLACDRSGVGVAVVDFGDSLICLSRSHTSQDAGLWLTANPETVPPEGTPVKLVIRAAVPRAQRVRVDFRGAAFVDGRYVSPADLADLILLARQLAPAYVQPITLEGTLRSDENRIRKALSGYGVPAAAFRCKRPAPPTSQPQAP
jgi:hypothetical protein